MRQYAHLYPTLPLVLRHVEASITAEQVFCSIVTEMKWLPQFKDQPPLKTVHDENYETSYHRNTAAGNLHRLVAHGHANEERLLLMTIECFVEARAHDMKAETALSQISASSPADEQWLEAAKKWHKRRRRHLRRAARLLRSAVGEDMWAKGVALAE